MAVEPARRRPRAGRAPRRATSPVTTPAPRTSAKSRTRFSSRLATRGVPRERSAIAALALGLDLDPEDAGGAAHDPRQVAGLVVLEPVADAEAVAKRRRQEPGAGGRADQRERRQVEGHRARAGALAEHDGQAPLLHRRVERLLDRAAEAVDLVDEEHRAGLERGQEGGDVGLALQRRAGGLDERRLELGGDDVGERGLAEPGRPGEQHVVERLAAPPGRLDEHLELAGDLLLVDEVGEAPRAQRAVELVLAAREPGVGEALLGAVRLRRRRLPPARSRGRGRCSRPRSAAVAGARSAAPISSSALSPSAAVEQPLGLGERVAEVHEARRGRARAGRRRRPRRPAGTPSVSSPATFSRSSTISRSAVRLPTPGTAWKRFASPAAIARSSSRGAPPERIAIATFGPIPETEVRWRKRSRSSSLAKP